MTKTLLFPALMVSLLDGSALADDTTRSEASRAAQMVAMRCMVVS